MIKTVIEIYGNLQFDAIKLQQYLFISILYNEETQIITYIDFYIVQSTNYNKFAKHLYPVTKQWNKPDDLILFTYFYHFRHVFDMDGHYFKWFWTFLNIRSFIFYLMCDVWSQDENRDDKSSEKTILHNEQCDLFIQPICIYSSS